MLLSDPAFGPVDPAAGLDLSLDRAFDVVAAFVQGTGDQRRLVIAGLDRKPGNFKNFTSTAWKAESRPVLNWSQSFDLWPPITYTLLVDGNPVLTTGLIKPPGAVTLADGVHTQRVIATDRRGQQTLTKTTQVRIDTVAPKATARVTGTRRVGSAVRVTVTASDPPAPVPVASPATPVPAPAPASAAQATPAPPAAVPVVPTSGVDRIRISFGDGEVEIGRRATHRYTRAGRFRIRVLTRDRARNTVTTTQTIVIARPPKPKKKKGDDDDKPAG